MISFNNFEAFLLFVLSLGVGELAGFTMSSRAFKEEMKSERAKVIDQRKELNQCYDQINKIQSELAYYKCSWSSHLRKVEEYNVSYESLCKEWDMLSTKQKDDDKLISDLEKYLNSNVKLKNSLIKSVKRNQGLKKEVAEMKSVIRKLEIWGDELVQKVYFLENQLDHEREMS